MTGSGNPVQKGSDSDAVNSRSAQCDSEIGRLDIRSKFFSVKGPVHSGMLSLLPLSSCSQLTDSSPDRIQTIQREYSVRCPAAVHVPGLDE